MKAIIKMNSYGHLEIWSCEKDKNTGREAELYLQSEVDVNALLDEIGLDSSRELRNGWTIYDQEIDSNWIAPVGE